MKPRTRSIVTAAVVIGGYVVLTLAERRRPLRRQTVPSLPRAVRNVTMGLIALAGTVWARPSGCSRRTRRRPDAVIGELILLDYSLWWWHRWNHEWPLLWRFHLVHHADRDMDASTAFRFHIGEHFLSQIFRRMQIAIIRPSPFALWLWQTLLFASILFHHSNLRLPAAIDAAMTRWIVTPRMHGIHHSQNEEQTRSNYSSILTWWDEQHGTLLLDVPQDAIRIGTASYPDGVTLTGALTIPFRRMG